MYLRIIFLNLALFMFANAFPAAYVTPAYDDKNIFYFNLIGRMQKVVVPNDVKTLGELKVFLKNYIYKTESILINVERFQDSEGVIFSDYLALRGIMYCPNPTPVVRIIKSKLAVEYDAKQPSSDAPIINSPG